MTAIDMTHLSAVLADRYRIESELGGGGMSRVFVADEIALDRKVVIKVVAPELVEAVLTKLDFDVALLTRTRETK